MQLIRLVFIVWLLIVALVAGAELVGRSQPEPLDLTPLSVCDGQPCYLGMVLETTSWEEAKDILNSKPGFTLNSSFRGADVSNGPVRTASIFSRENGVIFEIDLAMREAALPVANMLAQLGPPCAVYPLPNIDSRYPYTAILAYPTFIVFVSTKNAEWRIEPSSPITFIYLGGPFWELGKLDYSTSKVDSCRGTNKSLRYEWRGMRPYPRP